MKLQRGRITIDTKYNGIPTIRDTSTTVASLFIEYIQRGVISVSSGAGNSFDHTDIKEACQFITETLNQDWAHWSASADGVRHAKLPKGFQLIEE